ncbi:putative fluoride ion transporter CrcB [Rhodococcoides trifolii]|uniref:Fluoride-specific ion channel FluC n=1 Tax=Rhodococcoides trifolii TaxID=908250 RepID=A0A917D8C8_9NOCA|nr:fluoride efflux transporter CrcB [Rhodococcus trifolii]GGG12763.1 putative fluoride ion transporter CrcB [Rhodococcus trifolii]
MIVLTVLVAGALGSVVRFTIDSEIKRRWRRPFPLGTFVVNVTGSLVLGVLAGLVTFHGQPPEWQTVLGTGFCGGYTTFSTASVETVRLVQAGERATAAANALGSVVSSVAACALGLALVWVW